MPQYFPPNRTRIVWVPAGGEPTPAEIRAGCDLTPFLDSLTGSPVDYADYLGLDDEDEDY